MILESMFDIIRVENSKLTSQNINSPPSLLVISYKVSLENLVLHRLHLFTSPNFNFKLFLNLVPRVFAHLDYRWEIWWPWKKTLIGCPVFRMNCAYQAEEHVAQSSRWCFTQVLLDFMLSFVLSYATGFADLARRCLDKKNSLKGSHLKIAAKMCEALSRKTFHISFWTRTRVKETKSYPLVCVHVVRVQKPLLAQKCYVNETFALSLKPDVICLRK